MKIYEIYAKIPNRIYDNRLCYLVPNTMDYKRKKNYSKGLYAWTDDKDLLRRFLEERKEARFIYTIKTKKIHDEYLEELEEDSPKEYFIFRSMKLAIHQFEYPFTGNGEFIVSTENEYMESGDNGNSNMYNFGPDVTDVIPLTLYKEKYINVLDSFNYISLHYIATSDNIDVIDTANYNASYNIGALGNTLHVSYGNMFGCFLYLFSYMIYGEEFPTKR